MRRSIMIRVGNFAWRRLAVAVAALALLGLVGAAAAQSDVPPAVDDFFTDLVAAGPYSYDHATGLGGAYGDGTISESAGVVESLQGNDFACGDLVVFFTRIMVNDGTGTVAGTVEVEYQFGAMTTTGGLVGYTEVLGAAINAGDTGNRNLDGDETVVAGSVTPHHDGLGKLDSLRIPITVGGLAFGDQLVVRLTARLACREALENVTGNLHVAVLVARTPPGGSRINVGGQDIPMTGVGDLQDPPPPPAADAGGPYAVAEGGTLALGAAGAPGPDGAALTYAWDVNGDGAFGDAAGRQPTLAWAQLEALAPPIDDGPATIAGVRVRVDDGAQAATSAATRLDVANAAPTAEFGNDGPVAQGNPAAVRFANPSDPSAADARAGFRYAVSCAGGNLGDATYAASDPSPTASCAFAEAGEHVVTGRILDKDGGSTRYATTVTVRDTTPPTLTVPGPVTADATGPAGAEVAYAATATDSADPAPAVACTPPPGSTFPVGTTTVTCVATDAAGNASDPAGFAVTVVGAAGQLDALAEAVADLDPDAEVGKGLVATLERAHAAAIGGNEQAACGALGAFAIQAEAQSGRQLSGAEADRLISAAGRIRSVLDCEGRGQSAAAARPSETDGGGANATTEAAAKKKTAGEKRGGDRRAEQDRGNKNKAGDKHKKRGADKRQGDGGRQEKPDRRK